MKRQDNETYEQYKERRKKEQYQSKRKLSGKYMHISFTTFKRQKDVKRAGFTHALRNAKGYAYKLESKKLSI